MKKILFILLILAIPALLLAAEPEREWKSKDGQITQAAYDGSRDTNPATVPLIKDGKKYRVQFNKLSKADQDYVTKIRSSRGGGSSSGKKSRNILVVPSGNQYVLLIGVNEYVKPIKSLKFCVKDMELLSNCIQNLGVPKENIFLVTDDSPAARRPTGANIRRQIENVTSLMEPDDQLIVAFSGHGVMVDGKSYLCPSDTNLKDKNSIVSCDWVFEQLEKCKAKQKVFIIDACRSELTFGGDRTSDGARTIEDPIGADAHGFILIASCDKTQRSWEHPDLEHGVFTHFFVEGLSGAAADEDGYISIMNLFRYTSSKTKKYVFHEFNEVQVPTCRQGGEMTDFNLARVDGASPNGDTKPPFSQLHSLHKPGTKAGERRILTVHGIEFAFRWCPPGTFTMGSPIGEPGKKELSEAFDLDFDEIEKQHQVTLTKGFWMMETEVTVGMFKAFVDETKYESTGDTPFGYMEGRWQQDPRLSWRNPSFTQDDTHPVTDISWDDAVAFCRWLSKKTGENITLPTEAQWEYACRAGTTTALPNGPLVIKGIYNAPVLDPIAWYGGNSSQGFIGYSGTDSRNFPETQYPGGPCGTHPVGKKNPNNWGLYDMIGNVWEWCSDWYGDYPSGSVTDPVGLSSGRSRVCRGSGWENCAGDCRSAVRVGRVPGGRSGYLGFRVSRTVTSTDK